MSITKEEKNKLVQEFSQGKNDTGSVEVQCAIFTKRIKALTEHFNGNRKDYQSRRGLLVMVNKRKRLLNFLKKEDKNRHQELIKKLGLRK